MIIIIGFEVYIIQSYYDQQKLAAVSDFVNLKWSYVPKTGIQLVETANSRRITKVTYYNPIHDESNYIPIFVKKLRSINA